MSPTVERRPQLPPERAYTERDLVSALSQNGVDQAGIRTVVGSLHTGALLHAEQKRESLAPFIQHPLAATIYLVRLGYTDIPTLVATLIHDVPEDTLTFGDPRTISHEQWMLNIHNRVTDGYVAIGFPQSFGEEVADITVTLQKPKVNNIDIFNPYQATDVAMAKLENGPVKAVLVRIAERLHNARTLEYLSINRQRAIVIETEKTLFPIFKRAVEAFPSEAEYLMDEMRKALAKAKSSWGEPFAFGR